jgi:hypothetical protein
LGGAKGHARNAEKGAALGPDFEFGPCQNRTC